MCLYTCNNFIHAVRTDPTSFSEYLLCGLNKLFYNELIYCRSGQYYAFPCLPPPQKFKFFDNYCTRYISVLFTILFLKSLINTVDWQVWVRVGRAISVEGSPPWY